MTATQWIVNTVATLTNSLWGFGAWLAAFLIVLGIGFFAYLAIKTINHIVRKTKKHRPSKKTVSKKITSKRGK